MSLRSEKELRHLVAENVISEDTSKAISDYYASQKKNSPNKLFTLFGVLGGLLIGLGVILILAHNWDDFSRGVKTIWAFAPLVVGQAFAGFALWKKKGPAWKETAAAFLFFAIGASISLVSQIYNIPGSMSSFLLTWILLAAPMVYLLRSHTATLLHLIFATAYACNVGYFNDASPWGYLVLLVWVLPLYYSQLKSHSEANITGIYHWAFGLSVIITLGAFVSGAANFGYVLYILLFGILYNLGKLPFFDHKKVRVNGYLVLGTLGMIYLLMVASFKWIWNERYFKTGDTIDLVFAGALVLITLGILFNLYRKRRLVPFNVFQYVSLLFVLIYAIGHFRTDISIILVNVLTLLLGVSAVRTGAQQGRYGMLNFGMLIITILIACRFFDTQISFVVRGLLFVGIGVGFFVANYLMYKKQIRLKNE
ncbi:DUF2157 domain-containing protein [Aureisphaera galaxeae]|uniref:DUF2157 domain-containing protein n=1 Tax=Aureisphaera galaxeae TaxID=1538023 RepID=UPI002350F31F|nr:DUF2157 domain-containing protein [Aureisphaera galaxeae]MDC8005709.1 DUF2157 domain-containing protein [Aureisphaera galaxeae]